MLGREMATMFLLRRRRETRLRDPASLTPSPVTLL